jgi:hypothetical protein
MRAISCVVVTTGNEPMHPPHRCRCLICASGHLTLDRAIGVGPERPLFEAVRQPASR